MAVNAKLAHHDLKQDQHLAHSSSNAHRAKIPVIPDFRFEYSYLRSIQPYFELRTKDHDQVQADSIEGALEESGYEHIDSKKGKGKGKEEDTKPEPQLPLHPSTRHGSEVFKAQWGRILWVTMRDQVISPLLQGALWAVASYFIAPFTAQFGARAGGFLRSHLRPPTEGLGVGWLRNWVKAHGLSGSTPSSGGRP